MITGTIRVSEAPKKTRYLFGEVTEIAGKELHVIEKNQWGDCLCIFKNNLIDVDHEDVAEYKVTKIPLDNLMQFIFGRERRR